MDAGPSDQRRVLAAFLGGCVGESSGCVERGAYRSLVEVKNGDNGMRRYRDEVVERVRNAAIQNGRVVSVGVLSEGDEFRG